MSEVDDEELRRELELEMSYEEFFDLVESDDIAAVSERLSLDPSWANAGFEGLTKPLHRASSPEMVDLLVRHGANVNARGVADDMTPLTRMAKEGQADVARALIAHGADVNAVDGRGYTALLWATQDPFEGEEIFEMLLEAGAEYDIDSALSRPDLDRIHEILKADPDAVSRIRNVEATTGRIFCIARHDEPAACEVLELVLEHGPQVHTDWLRRSAKHARDQGSTALAAIFDEYAARST